MASNLEESVKKPLIWKIQIVADFFTIMSSLGSQFTVLATQPTTGMFRFIWFLVNVYPHIEYPNKVLAFSPIKTWYSYLFGINRMFERNMFGLFRVDVLMEDKMWSK